MLEDAAAIRKVVIACGYVDLRKGIDGLSMIIGDRYRQNPFEKGTHIVTNNNITVSFFNRISRFVKKLFKSFVNISAGGF